MISDPQPEGCGKWRDFISNCWLTFIAFHACKLAFFALLQLSCLVFFIYRSLKAAVMRMVLKEFFLLPQPLGCGYNNPIKYFLGALAPGINAHESSFVNFLIKSPSKESHFKEFFHLAAAFRLWMHRLQKLFWRFSAGWDGKK